MTSQGEKPNAIVLLSGGLDSATLMAMAKKDYACHAISFNYNQRHCAELDAARNIAERAGVTHQLINIDAGVMLDSALTNASINVPDVIEQGIPVTYVPARNTIFLAHALAVAEVRGASDIFIGVNAVDYSGYPDCRPAYIKAFITMANLATKTGVEGNDLIIHTPLINMTKAEIIKTGTALGVDYRATVSCYRADAQGRACGVCASCRLRRKGFEDAGIEDTTLYSQV